jgi:hypothetical protein
VYEPRPGLVPRTRSRPYTGREVAVDRGLCLDNLSLDLLDLLLQTRLLGAELLVGDCRHPALVVTPLPELVFSRLLSYTVTGMEQAPIAFRAARGRPCGR